MLFLYFWKHFRTRASHISFQRVWKPKFYFFRVLSGNYIWTKFFNKILANLTWHQIFKIFLTKFFNKVTLTRAGLVYLETDWEKWIRERNQVLVAGVIGFREPPSRQAFRCPHRKSLTLFSYTIIHSDRCIQSLVWVCGDYGYLSSSTARISSSTALHCKLALLPLDTSLRCSMMMNLISFS